MISSLMQWAISFYELPLSEYKNLISLFGQSYEIFGVLSYWHEGVRADFNYAIYMNVGSFIAKHDHEFTIQYGRQARKVTAPILCHEKLLRLHKTEMFCWHK